MLFVALLPLIIAGASARSISSGRIPRSSGTATSPSAADLDSRGLLDGLVGGLGQTVGGLGGTLGGLLGGVGSTVGGSLGGTVSGLGGVVGGTVITLGGSVVEVSKLNLEVLVNTCVRLGTAVHVNEGATVAGGLVGQGAGVNLAAGACVCVDAATSVGLAGVDANVGVYASGGLTFNGSAAADIASSTQPGLLGLQAGVYNFNVVETCLAASVSLTNSHHDLQPVGGSCCARACNAGYVLTGGTTCCLPGSSLDSNGQCQTPPTCTSTEILCNNQCYPRATYTCPSGLPVQIQSKRSENCPVGLSKCSVGALGSGLWECIDTKSDIESCGGCMYPTPSELNPLALSQGVDCTSLAGTNGVSCVQGQCQIQSCAKGFELKINNNGTSCEEQQIDNLSQSIQAMSGQHNLINRSNRIRSSRIRHQARLHNKL
ncbi:uncharacterized protein I303_101271 [Kwoniella dejecticola CBS 10117]|uniref:Protein CPL1-like domain-containing protein n=1 Tax=Kwoniella dejecticola CBS 10117 TaxID=1296121 RepID=A0A1A6AHB6_9TREE|nr:uncharacterized protein I303_01278 [Kwoniella dejecticola CBS 10117]OBR89451.1 hypothetical protein I303_01278 [Kwoniella dejecticola CBS 10117]